jgi:hypothetical protein
MRVATLCLLIAALLFNSAAPAFADTTGAITGQIVDSAGLAIAGATIAATSPSQAAQTKSDAKGQFSFLALSPDTYTLTVVKGSLQSSVSGVTVTSEGTAVQNFRLLTTIGKGTALGGSLVKRGETADVYTVSGQLAQTAQQLGGGGTIGQTYSQMASLPGVYVPQGLTSGQESGVFVRGGDSNQVGYEFDGIPVNRSFDNYVSNTQGITGEQELQVYTGGIDATSTGQGLAGFINQTIKRGTYPGSGTLEYVGGAPAPYNSGRFDYGLSNQARTFSFYVAQTNWEQKYRYGSQFQQATEIAGNPYARNFAGVDADGNAVGLPLGVGGNGQTRTSETVGNFIFGIPQKNGNRDEIQALFSIGRQILYTTDSPEDFGAGLSAAAPGFTDPTQIPAFTSVNGNGPSLVNTGAVNAPFNPALTKAYYYPTTGPNTFNDPNGTSVQDNNNAIEKLQYQKNFDKGFVRLYGYANFSDWLISSPDTEYYAFLGNNADYELSTHSIGGALQAGYQLNANNTLSLDVSYVKASVLRANNNTLASGGYTAQIRNAAGNCYDKVTGLQTNCYSGATAFNAAATYTAGQAIGATPAAAAAAGGQLVLATPGFSETINQVSPEFTTYALQDNINVGTKLKLNLGLRFDNFKYVLADTSQQVIVGGEQGTTFTEYNLEHCASSTGGISLATAASGFTCGAGTVHTSISNSYPGQVETFEFEPRVAGTYTLDPKTVVRFSGGKYSTPIDSAAVQYNHTGDLASYTANTFSPFGFSSPEHPARPTNSYNFDFSFERQLTTGAVPSSVSLTPFYRHAEDQTSTIYLDAKHGFVSSLNVGNLYAYGVEALARVGDFNRNGLSAQAAFTYTKNKIVFTDLYGSSRNYIDGINDYIQGNASKGIVGFNQLTQAGGGQPTYNGKVNPYYNDAPQPLFNPQGSYSPFDVLPGGTGVVGGNFGNSTQSYEIPYTTTLIVQYKHDHFRFSPSLQIDAGQKYGSPFTWYDQNPSLAAGNAVYIPDPYTGKFDTLGQFFAPTTASISASTAYDFGKAVTLTLIGTNLFHHCYSHGQPWEQGGNTACNYGNNVFYGGPNVPAGGNAIQGNPFGYSPSYFATLPINLYASVQFHL